MPTTVSQGASQVAASANAQPAPWYITGLGIVASLVVSIGHLDPAASAIVFSLATAIGTIVTAFIMRPVAVPLIAGAATVVMGDMTIVGIHLQPDIIAAITAALSFVLGMALHQLHVATTNAATASVAAASTAAALAPPPALPPVLSQPVPGEEVVPAATTRAAGQRLPGPPSP